MTRKHFMLQMLSTTMSQQKWLLLNNYLIEFILYRDIGCGHS